MKSIPASLAYLTAFLLLTLVGFNLVFVDSNKDTPNTSKEGRVLPGSDSTSYYYKFYLKDASVLGAVLNYNNENNSSYLTGATAVVVNTGQFQCGENGSSYSFAEYSGLYKIICKENTTMQVQISKDGYETKIVNLTAYTGDIPTITLSKYVAPAPPPPETIKDVSLPSAFTEKGTSSTDLSKITNTKKVKNLTLDTKQATIIYKETLDLSATDTKNKFKVLDKYVIMKESGTVTVDSKNIKPLNKKAQVTMKDLSYSDTPRVLVNGEEDKAVVSDISYKDGVLTFDVTGFSTLQAAPNLVISSPTDDFETNEKEMMVSGMVTDTSATLTAALNGAVAKNLKVATDSGKFSVTYQLVEGYNKVVLKATSKNGTSDEITLNGTYTKKDNMLPFYGVLGILAALAVGAMVLAIRKMKKPKSPAVSVKTTKETTNKSN